MKRICQACGRIFNGDPAALKCPDCVKDAKSSTLRDRTCRACGKIFSGGPRAWYCPECRSERQKSQSRQFKARKRAGAVRELGSTDICVICGKPYIVTGGLQRYCPACAPDAVRAIDREQSRAWNDAHTTPEQRKADRRVAAAQIPCVICGKLFTPAPDRANAKTCSLSCAQELTRRNQIKFERIHKEKRTAAKRANRKKRESAMSPEEYTEYRAEINRRARENYTKRKQKPEA